jgi:LysR family transcriptional regulator, mexEF-oprN operon transcriptional activator
MMNRNDLRRTDINLLVVFETMMHERSVTRVSEKLCLGQPTISSALGRLRLMFDDPLFIRTGRSMEPTARAEEIFQELSSALDIMAAALSRTSGFSPATSQSTFHIGLSDDVEYALLPLLLRRIRIEAPDITLVIHRVDSWQMPHLLASGEISLGVSYTRDLPANAKRKFLRFIRPMVLRADSNPGGMSLDEFCRRPHATVSSMGHVIDETDRALGQINRVRKVVLAVPQFSSLPALLVQSDIIALVPDYVANAMARSGELRAESAPVDLPSFELSMAWRGATQNDPAEQWLRSLFSLFLSDHSEESMISAAA